ncbi:hypothetical protein DIPPA_14631 [Diplonema papillatum]|nr:hypothetical protein DIPPA_14631 [Diplonema papillatum]
MSRDDASDAASTLATVRSSSGFAMAENGEEVAGVYLGKCRELGVKPISSFVKLLTTSDLSEIVFDHSYFGDRGLNAVAFSLRSAKVSSLSLQSCMLDREHIAVLRKELAGHPYLAHLNLRQNDLGPQAAKRLLDLISASRAIVSVEVDDTTPKSKVIQQKCLANTGLHIPVSSCVACGKEVLGRPVENVETAALREVHKMAADIVKQPPQGSVHELWVRLRVSLRENESVLAVCDVECVYSWLHAAATDAAWAPTPKQRQKLRAGFSLPPASPPPAAVGHSNRRAPGVCQPNGLPHGESQNQPSAASPHHPRCSHCRRTFAVPKGVSENPWATVLDLLAPELEKAGAPLGSAQFARFVDVMASDATAGLTLCSRRCARALLRQGILAGGGFLPDQGPLDGTFHEAGGVSAPPASLGDFLMPFEPVVDQGEFDLSAALAVVLSLQAGDGTCTASLDPLYTFAAARHTAGNDTPLGFGVDLRSACASAVTHGVLPAADAPFSVADPRATWGDWGAWQRLPAAEAAGVRRAAAARRKHAFFRVAAAEQGDLFDAVRTAVFFLLAQKRPVVAGCKWRPQWGAAGTGGVVPYNKFKGGAFHAARVVGQKVIHSVPHLVVVPNLGSRSGDRGRFYFTREVFNREFKHGAFVIRDTLAPPPRCAPKYPSSELIFAAAGDMPSVLELLSVPRSRVGHPELKQRLLPLVAAAPAGARFLFRSARRDRAAGDEALVAELKALYARGCAAEVLFFWEHLTPAPVRDWAARAAAACQEASRERSGRRSESWAEVEVRGVPRRTNSLGGAVLLERNGSTATGRRASSKKKRESSVGLLHLNRDDRKAAVAREKEKEKEADELAALLQEKQQAKNEATSASAAKAEAAYTETLKAAQKKHKRCSSLHSLQPVRKASHPPRYSLCTPGVASALRSLAPAKQLQTPALLQHLITLHQVRAPLALLQPTTSKPPFPHTLTEPAFLFWGNLVFAPPSDAASHFSPPAALLPIRSHPSLSNFPVPTAVDVVLYQSPHASPTTFVFSGALYWTYCLASCKTVAGPHRLGVDPLFKALPKAFHDGVTGAATPPRSPSVCFLFKGSTCVEWQLADGSLKSVSTIGVDGPFRRLPVELCTEGVEAAYYGSEEGDGESDGLTTTLVGRTTAVRWDFDAERPAGEVFGLADGGCEGLKVPPSVVGDTTGLMGMAAAIGLDAMPVGEKAIFARADTAFSHKADQPFAPGSQPSTPVQSSAARASLTETKATLESVSACAVSATSFAFTGDPLTLLVPDHSFWPDGSPTREGVAVLEGGLGELYFRFHAPQSFSCVQVSAICHSAPSAYATVLASTDGRVYTKLTTLRLDSIVSSSFWGAHVPAMCWKLVFSRDTAGGEGSSLGDRSAHSACALGNLRVHRVHFYTPTSAHRAEEDLVPFSIYQLSPLSRCKVTASAPVFENLDQICACAGAAPARGWVEWTGRADGSGWMQKHCVIPLLAPDGLPSDVSLFVKGTSFISWRYSSGQSSHGSPVQFSAHASFRDLPLPFCDVGLDALLYASPRSSPDTIILISGRSYLFWNLAQGTPLTPVQIIGVSGRLASFPADFVADGIASACNVFASSKDECVFVSKTGRVLHWSLVSDSTWISPSPACHVDPDAFADGDSPTKLTRARPTGMLSNMPDGNQASETRSTDTFLCGKSNNGGSRSWVPPTVAKLALQEPFVLAPVPGNGLWGDDATRKSSPVQYIVFAGTQWLLVDERSNVAVGPCDLTSQREFIRLPGVLGWGSLEQTASLTVDLRTAPKLFVGCEMEVSAGVSSDLPSFRVQCSNSGDAEGWETVGVLSLVSASGKDKSGAGRTRLLWDVAAVRGEESKRFWRVLLSPVSRATLRKVNFFELISDRVHSAPQSLRTVCSDPTHVHHLFSPSDLPAIDLPSFVTGGELTFSFSMPFLSTIRLVTASPDTALWELHASTAETFWQPVAKILCSDGLGEVSWAPFHMYKYWKLILTRGSCQLKAIVPFAYAGPVATVGAESDEIGSGFPSQVALSVLSRSEGAPADGKETLELRAEGSAEVQYDFRERPPAFVKVVVRMPSNRALKGTWKVCCRGDSSVAGKWVFLAETASSGEQAELSWAAREPARYWKLTATGDVHVASIHWYSGTTCLGIPAFISPLRANQSLYSAQTFPQATPSPNQRGPSLTKQPLKRIAANQNLTVTTTGNAAHDLQLLLTTSNTRGVVSLASGQYILFAGPVGRSFGFCALIVHCKLPASADASNASTLQLVIEATNDCVKSGAVDGRNWLFVTSAPLQKEIIRVDWTGMGSAFAAWRVTVGETGTPAVVPKDTGRKGAAGGKQVVWIDSVQWVPVSAVSCLRVEPSRACVLKDAESGGEEAAKAAAGAGGKPSAVNRPRPSESCFDSHVSACNLFSPRSTLPPGATAESPSVTLDKGHALFLHFERPLAFTKLSFLGSGKLHALRFEEATATWQPLRWCGAVSSPGGKAGANLMTWSWSPPSKYYRLEAETPCVLRSAALFTVAQQRFLSSVEHPPSPTGEVDTEAPPACEPSGGDNQPSTGDENGAAAHSSTVTHRQMLPPCTEAEGNALHQEAREVTRRVAKYLKDKKQQVRISGVEVTSFAATVACVEMQPLAKAVGTLLYFKDFRLAKPFEIENVAVPPRLEYRGQVATTFLGFKGAASVNLAWLSPPTSYLVVDVEPEWAPIATFPHCPSLLYLIPCDRARSVFVLTSSPVPVTAAFPLPSPGRSFSFGTDDHSFAVSPGLSIVGEVSPPANPSSGMLELLSVLLPETPVVGVYHCDDNESKTMSLTMTVGPLPLGSLPVQTAAVELTVSGSTEVLSMTVRTIATWHNMSFALSGTVKSSWQDVLRLHGKPILGCDLQSPHGIPNAVLTDTELDLTFSLSDSGASINISSCAVIGSLLFADVGVPSRVRLDVASDRGLLTAFTPLLSCCEIPSFSCLPASLPPGAPPELLRDVFLEDAQLCLSESVPKLHSVHGKLKVLGLCCPCSVVEAPEKKGLLLKCRVWAEATLGLLRVTGLPGDGTVSIDVLLTGSPSIRVTGALSILGMAGVVATIEVTEDKAHFSIKGDIGGTAVLRACINGEGESKFGRKGGVDDFLMSGTLEVERIRSVLRRLLLKHPLVRGIVSAGLGFSLRLDSVWLENFHLSRPLLCVRLVGVVMGVDYDFHSLLDPDNAHDFLTSVSSEIIARCWGPLYSLYQTFAEDTEEAVKRPAQKEPVLSFETACQNADAAITEADW